MAKKTDLLVHGAPAPAVAPAADLETLRQRLASARGPEYWRSLGDLARTPEFIDHLEHEFPENADTWPEDLDRRRFLQVMGASMALAGVAACTRQPTEKIIPYVRQPEQIVPGQPLYFASAHRVQGVASGILVESHMGRPTKVEGNPDHPASFGAADRFAQASVLDLYDPDRSRAPKNLGQIRTWTAFDTELGAALVSQEALRGKGLRILSETTTSLTFGDQLRRVRERFPEAKWHQWEAGGFGERAGTLAAWGEYATVRYDFSRADRVLALGADFLSSGPGHLAYARDFMRRRRQASAMNRLYVVESEPTNTGAVADHRLAMSTSEMLGFALALALEFEVHGSSQAHVQSAALGDWVRAVGADFRTAVARSIVLAGANSPPELHALAMAMNWHLGNMGNTVYVDEPIEVEAVDPLSSLRSLVRDLDAGEVDVLLILGGNPVFSAPSDLRFASAVEKAGLRVHLSMHEDETSEKCHWHLPLSHDLEAWSDARAFDGTVTIMQPLLEPLYGSRSVHEVMAVVGGQPERSGHDIVKGFWQRRRGGVDFETFWRRALHDGIVAGEAGTTKRVQFQPDSIMGICEAVRTEIADYSRGELFEAQFHLEPHILDGRYANNGWLQELPKPWTRLTWDNAALLSPRTAERLGVQNEDVVEIKVREQAVLAPVWIVPGHPETGVTLHVGYGRRRAGRVGDGVGVDIYPLRTTGHFWSDRSVSVRPTGERLRLACTQDHHSMEGRHLVREGTLTEFVRNPDFVHEMAHHVPDVTLYPPDHRYEGYAWGMAVDLSACTGCNACVVACNAENNIPVVGKDQVLRGREMHWLRIDRYFEGSLDAPRTVQQPVMCQQCENAPCEPVCPVGATMHSAEGLNDMVYNRCVGTRYCSNNCPYKVRRFNFYMYSDLKTESLKMLRNPDVTVRTRGVMEKCTYCVQRINVARIQSKKEGRTLKDGDVVTACQQSCPTEAIVFGNLNDPGSRVSRLRASKLNYRILEDLNTRARTSYLARLRNPNPVLETVETASHGH